ncbi:LacI family DNA-binding transcriptional regulator [Priestia aryabhattai]|uniref:LacI family DNA-binding transcriptional regulator n=1 Tax=Priestia aryabhattai TaxID=412384 RepID=UPI003D297146
MTTIIDIAQKAGVAKSTVSRYLNGGSVSYETKKKIENIISKTGYTPNLIENSTLKKEKGYKGYIEIRIFKLLSLP